MPGMRINYDKKTYCMPGMRINYDKKTLYARYVNKL